ncbi:MAG: DUF427 domain-containing protein [Sporolactobacillus sp.]
MVEKISPFTHEDKNVEWCLDVEPTHRWVRVTVGGETIADSKHALIVRETGRLPAYYFPWGSVRFALLAESGQRFVSAQKGTVTHWDIRVRDRVIKEAAWSYLNLGPGSETLERYIAFGWDKVDHWYEEEEELFKHPRDPHHRVDAIQSSRRVQVILNDQVVADSIRPVTVFETGLTPRYYLPVDDIRTEFLRPTETKTRCPYKGVASYWTAEVGEEKYEDVVWSYPQPLPEIPKIKGLLSFYNEKVDALLVDGEKWTLSPDDQLPSAVRPAGND